MPISNHTDDQGGWIELGKKLLASDSFHLSTASHQNHADQIKAIVDRVGLPKKTDATPFAAIDQYYNWFTSSVIRDGVPYNLNGAVETVENAEKYVYRSLMIMAITAIQ